MKLALLLAGMAWSILAAPITDTPTPPSPDIPGKTVVPVPQWQEMLNASAGSSVIAGDITAGLTAEPIGGAIGGMVGLIPQMASIFQTSPSPSDQFISELRNLGFSHFIDRNSSYQSGPFYYGQLAYQEVRANKTINPANDTMNRLLDTHLNDVESEADKNDIRTYITKLVNGWPSSSNVFVFSGIHYNSTNGGGAKVVKLVTNANTEAPEGGHASILFYSTMMDIKLADGLLIYRITDTSSNILQNESRQKDEIRMNVNYSDTLALYNFFDILAINKFATALDICSKMSSGCAYPSLNQNTSNLIL